MMPDEVRELMDNVYDNGYEIYIVGGYVRDLMLGIDSNDYDLCTNAPLEEIKKIYPKFRIMKKNNHRNTGTININNNIIEISSMKGDTIEEDLVNRDFTINAIAMDKDNKIIDVTGGLQDIENKIIRLCKINGEGLINDPLRILRAIRLASKYNFIIDPRTSRELNYKKNLLSDIAKERIYSEISKIMVTDNPSIYLRDYKEIFFDLIPELRDTFGFNQHNPWHIYDVFEHTLKVIENTSNNLILRLAALFHDIGKPVTYTEDENNIGHFYNHPKYSDKIWKKFAKTYKVDKETKDRVSILILNHDVTFSFKENKIKGYIRDIGTENIYLLFDLKKADNLAQNPEMIEDSLNKLSDLKYKFTEVINSNPVLNIKDLSINGKDLIDMEYTGKEIGIILNDLLDNVINEKIENNKEDLINYINKNYHKELKYDR